MGRLCQLIFGTIFVIIGSLGITHIISGWPEIASWSYWIVGMLALISSWR